MLEIVYVLYIIHASGNEVVAIVEDKKTCQIERANLIEARHYLPRFVKCKAEKVIEQKQ